ncbi:MAG: histidine kinase dimerization/phospho-acceptor domain-containing protein [Eubacteriales bacterium]
MVKELSNTETLRSDFVGNVSHEFKTPLSAIEGYATLLQDERLTKEEQALYVSASWKTPAGSPSHAQHSLALAIGESKSCSTGGL